MNRSDRRLHLIAVRNVAAERQGLTRMLDYELNATSTLVLEDDGLRCILLFLLIDRIVSDSKRAIVEVKT